MDDHETPQKIKNHWFLMNYQQQQNLTPSNDTKVTPKNATKFYRKSINPRTPKGQSISYSLTTCNSMMSNSGAARHSISMAVIETPPAKRYQKIRNPFEAALAERLHLPLIASPSLFQRADAPQMSSTQCEWTIEEVSSMRPANVEPHETQFTDSPDPEVEAKAQLAISSYFKEQQIVPSPVDCPLRGHRIVLNDLSGHTPISKPGRRIRDCSSQTELTLPPILPAALEQALKPYFQPHLAGSNSKELKKSRYASKSCNSSSSSLEAKDTSLRRKLFDIHNVLLWEPDQPQIAKTRQTSSQSTGSGHTNSSPLSLHSLQHTAIVGKLSDSLDKSSFGSLSPISAADDLSPAAGDDEESVMKRKSRFENLRSDLEDLEQLSPIHPPVRRKPLDKEKPLLYRSQNKENMSTDFLNNTSQGEADNEKFSPERSSSPLAALSTRNIGDFSSDSFNVKVSRLEVNSCKSSAKCAKNGLIKLIKNQSNIVQDVDIFMSHDETTEDMLECTGEIEDMQVSQLSAQSSNCSSSQSDTPRGKRRSASRKNLSQSFSANWLNEDEDNNEEKRKDLIQKQSLKTEKEAVKKLNFNIPTTIITGSSSFGGLIHHNTPQNESSPKKSLTFYRTDSGFNEMSQNSSGSQDCANAQQPPLSQMLMCCSSTPSTKDKFVSL